MPEAAEAARSGGRVGGGSFRASSRAAPRMRAQSRTAPPVGGYGYGYNSVFMPMPITPSEWTREATMTTRISRRTIVVIKEHALQYFYFRFERRDVATKTPMCYESSVVTN